jgi:hypothetical protein
MVVYIAKLVRSGQFVFTSTSADVDTVVVKMGDKGFNKDTYTIVSFIVGKEYTSF